MEPKNEMTVQEKATPMKMSEEQIATLAAFKSHSHFRELGMRTGAIDSPLKILPQLETDDITMMLLHIDTAHMTRAVDERGDVSDFCIVRFDEFPNNAYQGGKRLTEIILAWAREVGDDVDFNDKGIFSGDKMLPNLNELFAEETPAIILKWRKGKKNNYVDVIVL